MNGNGRLFLSEFVFFCANSVFDAKRAYHRVWESVTTEKVQAIVRAGID